MSSGSLRTLCSVACWPALIALCAFAAVVCMVDPAGSYPNAPQGPGLTLDESFNVQQGAYLVESARTYGFGLLDPRSLREVFSPPGHLADHPPLGRIWLGLVQAFVRRTLPPIAADQAYVTACARPAAASAFALTVFVVGLAATRWYGRAAGAVAATSLVLMPRAFGHAHLAALESFIGFFYTAASLAVAAWWAESRPTRRVAIGTGAILGLAMLTKIQGVLLPVPVTLWALARWRHRAIVPLFLWGVAAFAVFFVLWPWLWLDPVTNVREYLARTTERVTLYVWYFGERYADREVPWHYPFVMFFFTVPLGLQLLGAIGLLNDRARSLRAPREQVVFACLLFPMIVFAVPGIAVYDGVRLFLVSFPLWAVLIGSGASALLRWIANRPAKRALRAAFVIGMAAQAYGVFALAPYWLSYYNLAAGGLRGADQLGLTTTYWGDSVSRDLLQKLVEVVPAGSSVELVPILHPFQPIDLVQQSPILQRHGIKMVPFDATAGAPARYLLVFQRQADLPPSLAPLLAQGRSLAEVRREGVLLAALYEVPSLSAAQTASPE